MHINKELHCSTIYSCHWHTAGRWYALSTPISYTYETDNHDITEILFQVVLNNIKLPSSNVFLINHMSSKAEIMLYL